MTAELIETEIREYCPADWPDVRQIYVEGLASGKATFETEAPSREQWDANHLPFARLVAVAEGAFCGWAALSPVSKRAVYRGVAEVSVYVAESARGRGVGRKLLEKLVETSEAHGIWTLQASIFPENETSIALHKRCGFRTVGVRERIGAIKGIWRDTVLLERRSKTVGNVTEETKNDPIN